MQWRFPLVVSFFFSLVLLGSVFLLPESPQWLASVGCIEEATNSLAAYKGAQKDDQTVRVEISGIETSLEVSVDSASLRDIFDTEKPAEERLLYRFCLCVVLQFFQQMCGGNLISTCASTIFEENLHMTSDLARILPLCAMNWKFKCSFIAFFTIDRLSRRKTFMNSGADMSGRRTCLHGGTSNHKQLQQEHQLDCLSRLRLPFELILPRRLPGWKLHLLHGGSSDAASDCHVRYFNGEQLAMELCRCDDHPRRDRHHWLPVRYCVYGHFGLHLHRSLPLLPREQL